MVSFTCEHSPTTAAVRSSHPRLHQAFLTLCVCLCVCVCVCVFSSPSLSQISQSFSKVKSMCLSVARRSQDADTNWWKTVHSTEWCVSTSVCVCVCVCVCL
jgi:ABC-type Fe3+ transport system permease subunit